LDYIEYPYKPKPGAMLKAGLFFGVGALLLAHEASTNDRGLILNGIIHFDLQGATIFYWCVAAVCAAFAAIGLMATLFGLFSNQSMSLSETELSAPKYLLSLENTIVPLSSIVRLELRGVRNQHFLSVHHREGKLTISAANLPDTDAFGDICARLADYHLGQSAPGTSEPGTSDTGTSDPGAYTRTPLLEQPFTRRDGESAGFLRIMVVIAVFGALLFTAFGIMALMKMGPWAHS
jgi:hypothetical protein